MIDTAENSLLLAACRAVGAEQGIAITSPRLDEADDPLRLIARASGFRTRRVKLSARWWSEDGGAMLGRLAEDGRPIALIPESGRGYKLVDPARNAPVLVTEAVARSLQPTSVVFYRTLPADRPTFGRLVRLRLPWFGANSGCCWRLV